MLRKLRRRPSHGTVVAYLALFVALGGTSAYAIDTIGSSDVINESLLSEDIKNLQVGTSDLALGAVFGTRIRDNGILSNHIVDNTITSADINDGAIAGADIADDAITGGDIDDDTITGDDIQEATLDLELGAHAYGRVDIANCAGTPVLCPPEKDKGISEVRRITTGEYCITVPGVDARDVPAVASADWDSNTNPEGNTTVLIRDPELASCPNPTDFVVITERQPVVMATAGNAAPANDVGFQIVIP